MEKCHVYGSQDSIINMTLFRKLNYVQCNPNKILNFFSGNWQVDSNIYVEIQRV